MRQGLFADPDAFRTAAASCMRGNAAGFKLQVCMDAGQMPAGNAPMPWPQGARSPVRAACLDGVPSFRPSNSLQAHHPLGSAMRARLATCPALSSYRHQ